MAGSKGSKYFDVFLDYHVWLNSKSRKGRIDDQFIELLQEVDASKSIKTAATKLSLSYRKAWGDIKAAESFLGFKLVEATRGGKDGGITVLTENGSQLLLAFKELHQEFDRVNSKIIRKFFKKLNEPEGN